MEKSNIRTCSRCNKEKHVDEFRGKNRNCNECCERRKIYYENNHEKIKEKRDMVRQESYTCSLCNIDIKKFRQTIHEKSVGHQYFLQQSEKNEEVRKPDKIGILDGKTTYYCLSCKCCMLPNAWGAHCMYHINKLEK